MTRHKHADMIIAKAENMDLVVFGKLAENADSAWTEITFREMIENHFFDYFLCLPQHKEACLHWLNGGKVIFTNSHGKERESYNHSITWSHVHSFMNDSELSRIKPRKEKRYLMANSMSGACTNHFSTPERALDCIAGTDKRWQLIEIEVEVAQ